MLVISSNSRLIYTPHNRPPCPFSELGEPLGALHLLLGDLEDVEADGFGEGPKRTSEC